MKRIISLVLFFSALTITVQAQGVKFGFKGGLDLVNLKFDNDGLKVDNRTGWFVGPTLQASIIGGFGIDISALYDVKKYDLAVTMKDKALTKEVTQRSVLIPLNARYKIGLGKTAGIYLAAGPQLDFNIGEDYKDIFKDDALQSTFQLKKSNFSINLGAGVYVTKYVEVGFTYNIGLGSTADVTWKDSTKDFDRKPKSWQISAAIFL